MTDAWAPPPGDVRPASRRSPLLWVGLGLLVAVVVTGAGAGVLLQTRYRGFTIPSTSMEPTLEVGDHALVRRTHDVHDGDVVIFDGSGSWDAGLPGRRDYVKRVIALGGEHVHETPTQVVVDGHLLREPYLSTRGQDALPTRTLDLTVPAGRMWVLGDDRGNSADSRYRVDDGHLGTVPVADVVGVVVRHGSRAHTDALPLEQAGLAGLLAGAVVTGAGLAHRRRLGA